MILALLLALVAMLIARIRHQRPLPQRSGIRRHTKCEMQPASTSANGMRHYRAKPIVVRERLFRIAMESPDASCRTIADRFNRDHVEQGWSVGKTYVADFLREYLSTVSAPLRLSYPSAHNHRHVFDPLFSVEAPSARRSASRMVHLTRSPPEHWAVTRSSSSAMRLSASMR